MLNSKSESNGISIEILGKTGNRGDDVKREEEAPDPAPKDPDSEFFEF